MFYVIFVSKDCYGDTDVRVWNYAEQQFCFDIDAAYDKSDGFGYTTERYARRILRDLEDGNPFNVTVPKYEIVDRQELFWYLGVKDWRNS